MESRDSSLRRGKTYREILQIEPNNQKTAEALRRLEEDGNTAPLSGAEDQPGDTNMLTQDDSEAVPIETLLAPSSEDSIQSDPSHQPPQTGLGGAISFDDSDLFSKTTSEDQTPTFETDTMNLKSDHSIETARPTNHEPPHEQHALQGQILPDMDLSNLTEDAESASEDTFPGAKEVSEIDLSDI